MTNDNDAADRIAELEADNRRLRRLLDQRNAPSELRHRLRNTLALLRGIIRKSAQTDRSRDDYIGHLEDRLDALARAQATADEYGVVDLHNLVADELFRYGAAEGRLATLSGPKVELEPHAGQILSLAIHELAVNAVEHGALGAGAGQIVVDWDVVGVEDRPRLNLIWREDGMTALSEPAREGFGMEVLRRTIRYELQAETTLTFAPRGLCCTISFALTDRVGQLVAG
jgi:two-component sensor histidine kinase